MAQPQKRRLPHDHGQERFKKLECYAYHSTWMPQCYGSHVKTEYSKKVWVDVATAKGEKVSKPAQAQISPILELPIDLNQMVIRDNKQLQTVGHNWALFGSLPMRCETR